MSKITEYQQRLRQIEADRELQSVADFALELGESPESLLTQLRDAGVPKASALDSLTLADKQKLHKYLRNLHQGKTRRKKITVTIESQEKKLIQRVATQENGAELEALSHFAGLVVWGDAIDPKFQNLINLIVAKAVMFGALPMEKLGRPKRKELDSVGRNAAERYWEMMDSGIGYPEAVELLSKEFHKSERHIMRLIAPHKKIVGETVEDRLRNRQWNQIMRKTGSEPGAWEFYRSMYEPRVPVPKLSLDDYVEHLDELTQELAAGSRPLTKKI